MRPAAALAALCLLSAGPAWAHGGLAGGGGFLSGALHPFVAVPHLVLLLGIGLLSARVPADRRAPGFAALGLGLIIGVVLVQAEAQPSSSAMTAMILLLGLLAGLLAALAPTRLAPALVRAISLVSGLVVGLDTDIPVAGPEVTALVAPLLGVATGVYLIVLDTAALAAFALQRPTIRIAARVAGSWVAAVALMLLSLSLFPVEAIG